MTFLRIRKRNRLPHWDVEGGVYFITTNLFDAIPAGVRTRLEEERLAYVAEVERRRGRMTPAEQFALNQLMHERTEEALDAGSGSCWFLRPDIARIVADAIAFFDGTRYQLFAWTIMPNHIHMLFQMMQGTLDRVMQSLKTFTGRDANIALRRVGDFWQGDYWDRSVRDEREFLECVDYIRSNPIRAGLVDWPWVRVYDDRVARFSVGGPEVRAPGESPIRALRYS